MILDLLSCHRKMANRPASGEMREGEKRELDLMGKLHIISRSSHPFSDRKGACILLGNELKKLGIEKETPAVVTIFRCRTILS
jgi:hypothetical protein